MFGEINADAQTVCTRPSPPPILEGLGTRLLSCGQNGCCWLGGVIVTKDSTVDCVGFAK